MESHCSNLLGDQEMTIVPSVCASTFKLAERTFHEKLVVVASTLVRDLNVRLTRSFDSEGIVQQNILTRTDLASLQLISSISSVVEK